MPAGREQRPLNPVQKRGLWPPKNGRKMETLNTDTWWTVAARLGMDPWSLIMFNFDTHVPEEVNWYLRELVGCWRITEHRNYTFQDSNRTIYRPPVPAPAQPVPISWLDKLKKLKYQIEHVMMPIDPLKSRFLCMLEKMENKRDDRVIFWDDIAPGNDTPSPLGVTKNPRRSLADAQWLFDNFKTWNDVATMYPYGDGTDPRRFVLSLHKVLFETADGSLATLRWANDKIVETHVMLDRWANQSLGGSSGMPVEYRAIKEFLRLGERNDTVVSCIVSTGSDP